MLTVNLDGAGIKLEISPDFFKEKILSTGHSHDDTKRICVGMVFMPRNDFENQEKCRSIIEKNSFEQRLLYLWLETSSCKSKSIRYYRKNGRPEIAQVYLKILKLRQINLTEPL